MSVPSFDENVEENTEKQIGKRPKNFFGIRHLQIVLVFLATVLVFSMKSYMSIAIVAMTTESSNSNATVYSWDTATQSYILSSLNWGFIVLQIPGGMIATRYGSKLLCTIVILINGVVSLLIPISAEWFGWQGVCVCRAIQGLSQGSFLPVGHLILAKWVPLQEKGFLCTLAFGGAQMGMGTSILISGFLASTSWGWPSIFYLYGVVCAVWLALWLWLAADTPETSKWMSEEERDYILSSTGKNNKTLSIPWRSLLTSVPFWALAIAQCGHNWGMWILLTQIPTYMQTVLGVDIKTNGVMTALPYLAMYAVSFPISFLSDFTISKGVSISTTRKIFNTIGHWGPALVLIGLSYAPAGNVAIAVGFLVLIMVLKAGTFAGYLLVHIDLAPNFAGIMMGIGSFLGSMSAVAAPLSVGFIRTEEEKLSEWKTIFFITSAFYFVGNLAFLLFGSSEKQSWNEPTVNGDNAKPDTFKSVCREDRQLDQT